VTVIFVIVLADFWIAIGDFFVLTVLFLAEVFMILGIYINLSGRSIFSN
jgi:hypothetical protein